MAEKQTNPNGEWIPVYQEINGVAISKNEFSDQKLIILDNTYKVLSDKGDEGFISVNGNKLDIYGTDGVNIGRHLTAIYNIKGDELTICYNLDGGKHPADFLTNKHASYFLSTFKRAAGEY